MAGGESDAGGRSSLADGTARSSDPIARRLSVLSRRLVAETSAALRRGGWFEWLLWCAVSVILIAAWRHSVSFRGTEFDDAYITYRHAENLVRGRGPVYNPGERVEGTSAFLYMLVLAVPALFGADIPRAAVLVDTVAYLGLVVGAFLTVRMLVTEKWGGFLALGAATLVAACTPLAYYSNTGMETTPYSCLLLFGVYFHLRGAIRGDRSVVWPALVGLAAICRPEGALFFGLLLGLKLVRDAATGGPRAAVLAACRAVIVFACLYGPFLLFRVTYYGALVPNSVLAKSGSMASFKRLPLAAALRRLPTSPGAATPLGWLAQLGPSAFLLLPGLLLPKTRYATVVCLGAAASCALEAAVNDDWMPNYRLLAPAMALLAVAIALGFRGILFHASQQTRLGHLPSTFTAAVLLYVTADRTYYERNYHFPNRQVADYMKDLGRELGKARLEDDVLATDMAGIIPYYSGIRTIDVLGLCDRHIAEHGATVGAMGKIDWDYVIGRRPTFYQFNFPDQFRSLYQERSFTDQRDAYWAILTPGYMNLTTSDRKMIIVRRDWRGIDELAAREKWSLVDPRTELRRIGLWQ